MENYLKIIENKIIDKIQIDSIKIVNNSHLHKTHKFFDKNKYHLKIEIKSKYLNSFSRISAQRKIMKILEEDMKTTIHALEIAII